MELITSEAIPVMHKEQEIFDFFQINLTYTVFLIKFNDFLNSKMNIYLSFAVKMRGMCM